MKNIYLLTLLLCSFLASCVSVPELLEKGKYEEAYALALKHCTRARAPGTKQMYQFLDAYAAVQARDHAITKEIRRETGSQKWEALYRRYAAMHERSLVLLAVDPGGNYLSRYPHLMPARLEAEREETRRKAGAHYLALIEERLPAALSGEKPAAREAWELHQKVAELLPERNHEFAGLREELRETGTLRIILYATGGDFDRELVGATRRLRQLDREWTSIITEETGERIDLEAEIAFTHYDESSPTETCSTSEYEEEVLDYVEKKKVEERVNDSTVVERTIEIQHFKNVYATVTNCRQDASLSAYGELRVYRPGAEQPEWIATVSSWETWSNTYSFGAGDRRALPAFSDAGSFVYPPDIGSLLAGAVQGLPGAAYKALTKRYAPKTKRPLF